MIINAELKRYFDVACEVAVAAGKQLRISFDLPNQVGYKGERDPVTQADIDAEHLIVSILKQQFPEHGIISEEDGPNDSHVPFCWIIDPLDGTTNFIHGLAHFGVSIALEKDGQLILGVVYNPIDDELYTAMLGEGAFLNSTRLQVSNVFTLSRSIIGTGFGTSLELRQQQLSILGRLLQQCEAIREQGCASLGLCNVAKGTYDSYWEHGLRCWDIAAGGLLVMEAGGAVTNVDGTPFNHKVGNILATNRHLHLTILDILTTTRQT